MNELYKRNEFTVINKRLKTSARYYKKNGVWRLPYHFGLFIVKSGLVLQQKNYKSITKQIFGLKEFLTLYTKGNIFLASNIYLKHKIKPNGTKRKSITRKRA
jgi:hypothetical protein